MLLQLISSFYKAWFLTKHIIGPKWIKKKKKRVDATKAQRVQGRNGTAVCRTRMHRGRCLGFRQGHEALRLGLCIQGEVDVRALEPKPKRSLVFRRQYNPDQRISQKRWRRGLVTQNQRVFEKPWRAFAAFCPQPGNTMVTFCRRSPGPAVAQLYDLRHVTTSHAKPQFSQVRNGNKDSPQESPSERGLARHRCRTETWSDPLHSLPSCCQAVLPLRKVPLTSLVSLLLSCEGCRSHSPHHTPAHRSAPPLTERATDKGPSLIFVFSIYSHYLQHTYSVLASWKAGDNCVLTDSYSIFCKERTCYFLVHLLGSEQYKSYLKCVAGIPRQSSG